MGLLQAQDEERNQGLLDVDYEWTYVNILFRSPNSSVTYQTTPPTIMVNRV